jgi:DNA-3-methyladenine glycosylase
MAAVEAPALPAQGPVKLGRRLPRSFFARPPTDVAPDLLGRVLVRVPDDGVRVAARIVETEAYEEGDPASHSYRGRTRRTEVMFGPPGRLYVYFTYGMHLCMNVVVGREGQGAAVLLRAAEPLEGLSAMAERRGTTDVRRLCGGPARLTQAFDIGRAANGVDLVGGREMWLLYGEPVPPGGVARTTRVGVAVGTGRPWRYLVRGDPFVSPGRPARVTD